MSLNLFPANAETDARLRDYLRAVESFCPYVRPSLKSGGLIFLEAVFECEGSTGEEPVEDAFILGAFLAEGTLRNRVRSLRPILYSENAIVRNAPSVDVGHLFDYPHWILKCLYRQRGLVFGKFKAGDGAITGQGDAPINPVDLFTVRQQTNPANEAQFYKRNTHLFHDFTEKVAHRQLDVIQEKIGFTFAGIASADLRTQFQNFRQSMIDASLYAEAFHEVSELYEAA